MKYTLPITTLAALAISAATVFADGFQTGMTELGVRDTSGDRYINGVIWYPTDKTDGAVRAQGNAVWEPIEVHPNAEPSAGKHPLVLLSHGMYGNHRNQAWLASALTQAGYIVAAVDHPGTTTFNRDADHARELWKRPQDISRTIDYILENPVYSKHVDAENIFMAGHSLGGFTAVALAGGRFEPAKFDAFCASAEADIACGAINRWKVAKSDHFNPQERNLHPLCPSSGLLFRIERNSWPSSIFQPSIGKASAPAIRLNLPSLQYATAPNGQRAACHATACCT